MEVNSVTKFVYDRDIWTILKNTFCNADEIVCAVPYFNPVGEDFRDWKEGDVLIVALTEQNVREGNVDPKLIAEIRKKGVQIYTLETLHSKIYYSNDWVVVGSANVSKNAAFHSHEACILTNEKEVLLKVDSYIFLLLKKATVVESEFLDRLMPLYNILQDRILIENTKDPKTWIIYPSNIKYTDVQKKVSAETIGIYEQRKTIKSNEIDELSYGNGYSISRNMKVGDNIITVNNSSDSLSVHRPGKIVGIDWYNEHSIGFIRIERNRTHKVEWTALPTNIQQVLQPKATQKDFQLPVDMHFVIEYFDTNF